jgi:hypothetical protein
MCRESNAGTSWRDSQAYQIGRIERQHRTLEIAFLRIMDEAPQVLRRLLPIFIEWYNAGRPHLSLDPRAPPDVPFVDLIIRRRLPLQKSFMRSLDSTRIVGSVFRSCSSWRLVQDPCDWPFIKIVGKDKMEKGLGSGSLLAPQQEVPSCTDRGHSGDTCPGDEQGVVRRSLGPCRGVDLT